MKQLFPLLVTFFLVSLTAALKAADIVLVENGKPRAEIVVAETRPRMTTLAALELRHFIEKMSGHGCPSPRPQF